MKRFVICVSAAWLLSGCASSNTMEVQLKQMKEEIYATMRNNMRDQGETLRSEIKGTEDRSKADMNEMNRNIGKDIAEFKKSLEKDMSDIKDVHKKYSIETDKTLNDQQRQIFQNKTVAEDSARRIYMLEQIIPRGPVTPQPIREGFITYVENKKVSISIGSNNGVRAGDQFMVYKDKDNIGIVEIEVVERESSSGNVIESSKQLSVGDRIELKKK